MWRTGSCITEAALSDNDPDNIIFIHVKRNKLYSTIIMTLAAAAAASTDATCTTNMYIGT